jgi:GT2 family glycosyltransferase
VGGFSADFPSAAAEDRDFCDNWLYNGFSIRMAEEAIVYHAHDLNCGSFWRQHFRYGRGAALYHKKRTARRGNRLKIEPFAFYGSLVLFPFRSEGLARACTLSCLLILAQLANAAGFIAGTMRKPRRQI